MTPSEDGSKSVRIVAFNAMDIGRAKRVVAQIFIHETVLIPHDINLSTKAGELRELEQFCFQIQRGKPIKVQVIVEGSRRLVELVGVADIMNETKSAVENVLQDKRIKVERFQMTISDSIWDFLHHQFRSMIKPIEEELDNCYVIINLAEKPKVILLEGTTDGLRKCKETLQQLIQTIVQKDEIITSPDVQRLFASEVGKSQLKLIEKDLDVLIKKNQFMDLVPSSENATVSQSQMHRNGGVKITMRNGRIENEKVYRFTFKYQIPVRHTVVVPSGCQRPLVILESRFFPLYTTCILEKMIEKSLRKIMHAGTAFLLSRKTHSYSLILGTSSGTWKYRLTAGPLCLQ